MAMCIWVVVDQYDSKSRNNTTIIIMSIEREFA